MKKIFKKLEEMLADAALLEMGVNTVYPTAPQKYPLEEYFIEIAFAEAADYEEIHQAILREHQALDCLLHPGDRGYGEKRPCFV